MIDTDKYEGHTEGLWFDGEPTEISNAISNAFFQLNPNEIGKANARLAVDAPLLLEEVKRLRVIEERHRRMGNVLADYCIEDVCDEFFEGDYSFYERLVKAYRWKEGDEE